MAILTFIAEAFPDLPFVLFGCFWFLMLREAIRMWIDAGEDGSDENVEEK